MENWKLEKDHPYTEKKGINRKLIELITIEMSVKDRSYIERKEINAQVISVIELITIKMRMILNS